MASYYEKLKDPRWQKKRLEIMERDNFTCQCCGEKEKTLHVHHWKYGKNPWNVDNEFLVTYCEECHSKIQILEDFIIPLKKHLLSYFSTIDFEVDKECLNDLMLGVRLITDDAMAHLSKEEIARVTLYLFQHIRDLGWFQGYESAKSDK